jgi:hypothetical protein
MTASSLNLSARADLDWFAELIGDAKQAAPAVEWLVVGALARDLHLGYAHGIRVDRVTTDTDLALTVATWAGFAKIRHALIASRKFVAVSRAEHKFLHHSGQALDVVPFGDIEDRNRSIAWPPSGEMTMSVLGYREAFAGSIALQLPRGQQSVRKQLNNILTAEVDPAGRRVLIGQSGARDAEGFRLQVEAFLRGLTEGNIPPCLARATNTPANSNSKSRIVCSCAVFCSPAHRPRRQKRLIAHTLPACAGKSGQLSPALVVKQL